MSMLCLSRMGSGGRHPKTSQVQWHRSGTQRLAAFCVSQRLQQPSQGRRGLGAGIFCQKSVAIYSLRFSKTQCGGHESIQGHIGAISAYPDYRGNDLRGTTPRDTWNPPSVFILSGALVRVPYPKPMGGSKKWIHPRAL